MRTQYLIFGNIPKVESYPIYAKLLNVRAGDRASGQYGPLVRSGSGPINDNDVRARLRALQYRFSTVGRQVKVTNVEFRGHVGKLLHGARLKVDRPQILVLNLALQKDQL